MATTDTGDKPPTDSASAAKVIPLTRRSERVQAQLFAKMLRREIATMKKKVTNAESAWQHRCESEGYVDPPERLAVVRERIAEARRMLNALNARFPRS
ncbi:MAG: hypothetical protein ACLP4W_02310 [Mycobacterium sp.]|uniref:hypothetical protein n=1 Tax=Mycobacterium sp. TaxID=1785 RepID=UPI003F98B405